MSEDRDDPFVSEFKHWREVSGYSQTRLAALMGFHRTYISKIEGGGERATLAFANRAEEILKAGGALRRAWRETDAEWQARAGNRERQIPAPSPTPEGDSTASLIVEHDHAKLSYDGRTYTATQRRRLFNGGAEPVTRYLVRIAVDRYPGLPEHSNEHYRRNPLTWGELELHGIHNGLDPMPWIVRHDRDAFKEVWLLFENEDGKFPLYPGESAEIEYGYTVGDDKWGHWFQRAVRLPTRRLSVELAFPTELQPVLWGTETSLTAAAMALRTAPTKTVEKGYTVFAWSTEDPPVHARYRMEWAFRTRRNEGVNQVEEARRPSEVMASLGVVQEGDPRLRETVRSFDLPTEGTEAERVIGELHEAMGRIGAVHQFSKGMGLAAPQIGINRAAALVRTADGDMLALLNPRVIDESAECDEQYEGCMSFFDVRGLVPRPIRIDVEHMAPDGARRITVFERGDARLVAHEIDHLNGMLYRDRMRPGVEPIPVSEYKGTGSAWRY